MSVDSLSFYAIQRQVGGDAIEGFDDVIAPDRLASVDDTRDFQTADGTTPAFSARLYVWRGEPRPPAWVDFLAEGFDDAPIEVPDTAQSRAVLLVKVFFRVDRIYAIPFGGGRYQIRRDVIDRRYGLQVALNSLYEGDEAADQLSAARRIRQVESKTVAVNTMRTIRQTNRTTEFEEFAVDPDCDQLAGVTGQPSDQQWAKRVRGTDSIRLARRTSFDELGELCRDIARFHERKDYRRRFDFVDRFEGITDPGHIGTLTDHLREGLRDDPDAWVLAVPGIQNFDDVASYRIIPPSGDAEEFADPTVADIAAMVGNDVLADQVEDIRVESLDNNGLRLELWSLLHCLDGQLIDGDGTFLHEAGVFYAIEPDYLAQLDLDIDDIPESGVALPPSVRVMTNGELKEIAEGPYNEIAAGPANHLLLDKKTVVIPGRTSPIEVCDVLTLDRRLVHVKRKFSSSSLSHLFGQGYVSSELLVDSSLYREEIRQKIGGANPAFRDLFSLDNAVASEWEVVYAIVGPWAGGTAAEKLPFFAKVNLRSHARRLRRMGFSVTLARVPVIDP